MTADEQEALSFRHSMPRVMRLSSGNIAIFEDGKELQIIKIETESDALAVFDAIPSVDEIEAYHESLLAARPKASSGRLTSLNLADLGL